MGAFFVYELNKSQIKLLDFSQIKLLDLGKNIIQYLRSFYNSGYHQQTKEL